MICTDCGLSSKHYVGGEGPVPCRYMFVGEAPGFDEDRLGRPFVGRAGRVLDRLLKLAGLERSDVYVTNVVRYRPPLNRKPLAKEVRACSKHILEEIERVRPTTIVAMGRTAIDFFVPKPRVRMEAEHGIARTISCGGRDGVRFVPWYHPAAGLRTPAIMALLAQDALGLQNPQVESVQEYYTLDGDPPNFDTPIIGFDLETTSPKRGGVFATEEAKIVGYSTSYKAGQGNYVPGTMWLRGLVDWKAVTKVCHNTKFEYKVLKQAGMQLVNYEDTKLAAYLLGEPSTRLKDLARQLLGTHPLQYADVTKGRDMADIPPEEVYIYACMDADNTLRLWQLLRRRLVEEGLYDLYETVEKPLIPVLSDMEVRGVQIDMERVRVLKTELDGLRLAALTSTTTLLDRPDLNLDSPKQLATRLHELHAPVAKRTKKGAVSTDEESLQRIYRWNPSIVTGILNYRRYGKLLHYLDSWLELTDGSGRIHSSFNQAGTYEEVSKDGKNAPTTGRLSSSGPNLNNIPHHSNEEWGQRIRECICAKPGWRLLSADIEQEEPRIIAHVARDERLQQAFRDGRDIYRPATEAIYGRTIRTDLGDKEWRNLFEHERFVGKTFFLAWYYGAAESRLMALDPAITQPVAHDAIVRLATFHVARQPFIEETAQLGVDGVVQDMFGRKRWIAKLLSPDKKQYAEGLREAANFRIQGPGGTILKRMLVNLDSKLKQHYAHLVLPVHDEVVIECLPEVIDTVKELVIQSIREQALPFELPVSFKKGELWT